MRRNPRTATLYQTRKGHRKTAPAAPLARPAERRSGDALRRPVSWDHSLWRPIPMRQLPLPDALKQHIADLRQEIALTDADGCVVAYLFAPDQREAFYDMGAMIADAADPAEARRMIAA